MLTKEEYQKTVVRMWDSLRDDKEGEPNCYGVDCEECPLRKKACVMAIPEGSYSTVFSVYNAIEIVEQWGKEHPVMTNGDKFEEVFGKEPRDPSTRELICPRAFTDDDMKRSSRLCVGCAEKFWDAEYIPPKKEE